MSVPLRVERAPRRRTDAIERAPKPAGAAPTADSVATATTAEPAAVASPPQVAPQAEERRRVGAALFASFAALVVLVAFGVAWAYPVSSPVVSLLVVLIAVAAVLAAARADRRRLERAQADLTAENRALSARIEGISDTAWELREGEERYRALIDAQGDLVIRRDTEGRVTFANPAFLRAFGPGDLAGRVLPGIPPANPAAGTRDVRLETRDGPRWFAWIDIAMRDEIYSVARDITQRKESEQALVEARRRAEAASEAKSRVLATVSHEFRTPLNGILGLTGLLAETQLTPDQETYTRAVHTSGAALLALVDDMLDFAKIEAGRFDLNPEPTDIEALLQDIAELLAGRAHAKGIDIAVEVSHDLPPAVMADRTRLRQVLINLAGNAVKFTERGGVTLSAHVAGEERIAFTVSDTGPGIPTEEIERLFGEFEQIDRALSRRHGGTGLGLAISRRIVRRMGGDISVASAPLAGATFAFTLALPAAARNVGTPPDAGHLVGRSILIVAPDGAEAPVIRRELIFAGALVRIARNPNEAAALAGAAAAAGEPHDLLLVDERAGEDPGAVLAMIREAAGTPVRAVVLIEPGHRGSVEPLKRAGFDAYLVRPVRRWSLLRIAGDVIAGVGEFQVDPGDAAPQKAQPARRASTRLDVLLAEDNEINALLARAVLEGLGHKVTEVRDGQAAVNAVEAAPGRFAVILMDLHMPVLDGLGAAWKIRAFERAVSAERAAILAVTADVSAETRAAAEAAGVDAVLAKPMTPDALRSALERLPLEASPPRDQDSFAAGSDGAGASAASGAASGLGAFGALATPTNDGRSTRSPMT